MLLMSKPPLPTPDVEFTPGGGYAPFDGLVPSDGLTPSDVETMKMTELPPGPPTELIMGWSFVANGSVG